MDLFQFGPGVVNIEFQGPPIDVYLIHSVTPLEPMLQRLIHQLYIRKTTPGILGNLLLWDDAIQVCFKLLFSLYKNVFLRLSWKMYVQGLNGSPKPKRK